MGHYFENDPDLKSDPVLINLRTGARAFVSDRPAFFKGRVDFGSFLLLNSLPRIWTEKESMTSAVTVGRSDLRSRRSMRMRRWR